MNTQETERTAELFDLLAGNAPVNCGSSHDMEFVRSIARTGEPFLQIRALCWPKAPMDQIQTTKM